MKERSLDTTSLSDPALWEPVGAVPTVEIGTGGFEVIVFKTELGSVVGVAAAGVQVLNPKLKSADDTSLAFRLYVYLVSINIHDRMMENAYCGCLELGTESMVNDSSGIPWETVAGHVGIEEAG